MLIFHWLQIMMRSKISIMFIILCISSQHSEAKLWNWFALEATMQQDPPPLREPQCSSSLPVDLVKFDVDSGNFMSNTRGRELVERAHHQTAKHNCWHEAYNGLALSCREILREEGTKARFAMRLTNCFLQVSGRAQQHCPDSISISKCTSGLTDHINSIFLAFFIDIASMCHHLQSEAFKLETENVVNELKGSAHWVEAKLKTMESQTSIIMSEQNRLHERMQEHSVELMHEYQRLHSEMQEKIKVGISGISSTTKEVYKQLQGVASLQREMSDHQQKLVDSLSLEFVALHDKTNKISGSLTKEFSSLQAMSHEIAESLVTKFSTLHEKSHEIGNGVLRSLSGQEALLAGQGQAMEGLFGLKKLQEKALEESRAAMQELTHEAKMHQQEFLEWQKELYTVHQQLSVGSKAMLQAQEAFVSKQAAVFTSLERLFSLHNTILLESRALKTFLFYATSSIFVYMSTSAKQTYNARALIYCSLFLTFALELGVARYETSNSKKRLQQTLSFFIYPRFTFGVVAVSLLIYTIVTYRDYTTLSYQILVDLQQQTKVHSLVPTLVVEEDCQQSSTPLSRITRITPYEKALTKKILRRARACRSKF